MPNNYFQFKQFIIQQEKATLKVSTDSCLFGAWIADEVQSKKYDLRNAENPLTTHYSPLTILDIGAGSGLLMLMLAQKCDALIDGIEIDEPSYQQAKENIEASQWKDRLELFHADVKQFSFTKKYDLIISNPPFYEGDLKSGVVHRNVAMHDEGLKLDELIAVVHANLNEDGKFAVLLPWSRAGYFIEIANKFNFYLEKQAVVSQSENHQHMRAMFIFSRQNWGKVRPLYIPIRNGSEYSDTFVRLLKDYYLYL